MDVVSDAERRCDDGRGEIESGGLRGEGWFCLHARVFVCVCVCVCVYVVCIVLCMLCVLCCVCVCE